jgi:hypothetical protein
VAGITAPGPHGTTDPPPPKTEIECTYFSETFADTKSRKLVSIFSYYKKQEQQQELQ